MPNSLILLEQGKRPRPICRECRAIHTAARCPKLKAIPVITMRELRQRERLEATYGRLFTWPEVFAILAKRSAV